MFCILKDTVLASFVASKVNEKTKYPIYGADFNPYKVAIRCMEKMSAERLKIIGKKIKELRIEAGYGSYVAFAIEHELGRNFYWEVEKGRNITLLYLFKILGIHNLTLENFFKDID